MLIISSPQLSLGQKFHLRNSITIVMLSFLMIIVFSAFIGSPQDEIDMLYQRSKGLLSKRAVDLMKQNYIPHTEPCRKVSDIGGWRWKCVYRDGFVVYNCFRKCRGAIEAANYFLGHSKPGDCDSYAIVNGKREKKCFPGNARSLVREHGMVVAIERMGECWE